MMIPKSFRLGRYEVSVIVRDRARLVSGALGSFYPSVKLLLIAGKRPKKQVAVTFWHETTHAILYDMNHPLRDDEKFVTAFSKRLAQVVDTAVL